MGNNGKSVPRDMTSFKVKREGETSSRGTWRNNRHQNVIKVQL